MNSVNPIGIGFDFLCLPIVVELIVGVVLHHSVKGAVLLESLIKIQIILISVFPNHVFQTVFCANDYE
jgi:hypothetical protein